ncbi:addiction module toxin RelE [Kosmotoga sp. DU53]|nr:addiction module toxin RelE [Kosmotoga sp. DU53]
MGMSYRIEFTTAAQKEYNKLDRTVQKRIDKAFLNLIDYYNGSKNVPRPDVKILTGKYYGLLRLRVGDYRIIFKLQNNTFVILVIHIIKRGDAYKK